MYVPGPIISGPRSILMMGMTWPDSSSVYPAMFGCPKNPEGGRYSGGSGLGRGTGGGSGPHVLISEYSVGEG